MAGVCSQSLHGPRIIDADLIYVKVRCCFRSQHARRLAESEWGNRPHCDGRGDAVALGVTVFLAPADGRLARNPLKGALGDALHAVMRGAGHNLRIGHVHATVFGPPFVESRFAEATLAAQLLDRQSRLGLLDEANDLLVGVSAFSHVRHFPG